MGSLMLTSSESGAQKLAGLALHQPLLSAVQVQSVH